MARRDRTQKKRRPLVRTALKRVGRFLVGNRYGRLLLLVGLVAVLWCGAVRPFPIQGDSMRPTLSNGMVVLVDRLAYRLHPPHRGDVIVFKDNADPPVYYTKRIIALPYEEIEVQEGMVHINGTPIPEPYALWHPEWTMEKRKVNRGTVYVVGDNRSMDPRYLFHAAVSRGNIVGRVMGR